jgi:hypothetical protein
MAKMAHNVNTVYFPVMTASQYQTASKYYTQGKALMENVRFWEFFANAIAKYMAHGRVDPLNALVTGSLDSGNYRSFVRVAKTLCAHEYDSKLRIFTGKADKAKLRKYRKVNEDTGAERWEQVLYENMQKEFEHQATKPAKAWDEELKAVAFIRDLHKHDVDDAKHIHNLIESAMKKVAEEVKGKEAKAA